MCVCVSACGVLSSRIILLFKEKKQGSLASCYASGAAKGEKWKRKEKVHVILSGVEIDTWQQAAIQWAREL